MDLSNEINDFSKTLKPNEIIGFNQKIAQIPHLIKLPLGEPDFPTPQHIKRAAIKAINDNQSHYTNPQGILPLRQNAAKFLKDKYDVDYDPQTQITVTAGVTEGIHDVFNTILSPGDEVLMPSPIFSLYIPNIKANGAKPVFIDVSKDHFILSPERLAAALKAHPRTKALVLNYPNNPVGNTYNQQQLEGLVKVIKKHRIFCVSDEIYSELTYDHPHVSLGKLLPDQTILFNGVSKTFAMTGWRIGLVCGPANIISKINAQHTIAIISATTNAQYAASEAFKNGEDDGQKMKAVYQKRRDILRDGLAKAGFTSPEPQGAFYIFAKIPDKYEQDSFKFAYQLAKEAHVGTIPGAVFGPGGEGHLRFSYAASTQDLKEAVRRIQAFAKAH